MNVNNHETVLMSSEDRTSPDRYDTRFAGASLNRFVETMEQIIQSGYQEHDIEFVHKLRVTSRRIRAALFVFKDVFSASEWKRWNTAIKNITRSLGVARDTDVQIEFLAQLLLKLPEENMRPGVEYLVQHHRQYREELQKSVEKTLDELKQHNILCEMKDACSKLYDCSQKFEIGDLPVDIFIDAHKRIKKRYKEFIKLSSCLEDETAVKKHHKLRIAAKRLRYTLEIFQPLYADELVKNKLDVVKNLQDSLGLLHDYDVWIEYIPTFIDVEKEKMLLNKIPIETITNIERGLLLFLYYIREKRQEQFAELTTTWHQLRDSKWFDEFSDFVTYRFIFPTEYRTRLAFLSDVHGNLHALSAVIRDAQEQKVSLFFHAGDAVGYGAYPDEVVSCLRELPGFHILGNYDDEVLHYKAKSLIKNDNVKEIARHYARVNLSKENIDFLKKLPKESRFMIGEKIFAMYHGTPESQHEAIEKTSPDSYLQKQVEIARAHVIITGHSHVFLNKSFKNVLFLNPGSVGRPGNYDARAMYMIVDTYPFSVQQRLVEYDVIAAAEAIRQKKLPESFAQMFLRGVSLDVILEEEEHYESTHRRKMFFNSFRSQMNQTKKKKIVEKIAIHYDQYPRHSKQVTLLSLRLFDALQDLHGLGEKERYYLECAGFLHDIGWSLGQVGHHKASLKLILNNQKLPFSTRERYIIGCIARYHRKKLPQSTHYPFTELCSEDQKKVRYLAALLRVADALDVSHSSVIHDIQIVCYEQKVIIECLMEGIGELEIKAVDKKKDLFEKMFNRTLELRCRPRLNSRPVKSFPLLT
ncbi:MAG: CHAD domain-containing protein [Candidatus Thermoplasmatota archaeon]